MFTLVTRSGALLVLVLVMVTVCGSVLPPIGEVNERGPVGSTEYVGTKDGQ
jgi:hypothetical protein